MRRHAPALAAAAAALLTLTACGGGGLSADPGTPEAVWELRDHIDQHGARAICGDVSDPSQATRESDDGGHASRYGECVIHSWPSKELTTSVREAAEAEGRDWPTVWGNTWAITAPSYTPELRALADALGADYRE